MTDEAVMLLIWRCGGETMVIPAVDQNGDDNLLMQMLVEKLPDTVKNNMESAVLRGTLADVRGKLLDEKAALAEMKEKVAQLEMDNSYLNNLVCRVPVEGEKK